MNERIIESAKKYIKNFFQNDFSGHDYYHSMRVYNLATHIAQYENADIILVQLIALLHDVDDYKISAGSSNFKNTRCFLKEHEVSDSQIEMICSIIAEISYKGADTHVPQMIEGRIVQDADRLDAMGAIGIARTFAYGGTISRPIHNPEITPRTDINCAAYQNDKGTSINHFYEKLLCPEGIAQYRRSQKNRRTEAFFYDEFS